MSSKYGLWTGIFGFMIKADMMRSLIVTKVVIAPKLCAGEALAKSQKRGTDLEGKRLFSPHRFFYRPIVNVKGMIVISHRLYPMPINR
jgi:hypothetical protein